MLRQIPVLIHHELDTKPQTGGGKGQEYIKYCIMQAKKFNSRVVLFGDNSNRGFSNEWYDASEFSSIRWENFLEVFENMSDYPLSWAKSFFRRFYIFEKWMEENSINECVILDSDVLVYCDFSNEIFNECDVALEIPQNQCIEAAGNDNDLCWVACAGVAYFTLEALRNFNSFCIEMYRKQKHILEKNTTFI